MLSKPVLVFLALASAAVTPAMSILLNPNPTLSGNAAALAAFQRAANTWSSAFTDNITVNIDAGLADLGNPNVIGQASATILTGSYDTVRNAAVADAADEASNGIVASLPTAAQYTGIVPVGFSLANAILLTQANANALGFGVSLGPDGIITFNSAFGFDFDNTDGIGVGLIDFETVAVHEIGHVLGFISSVDTVDAMISNLQPGQFSMTLLDLFRFAANSAPTTAGQFTTTARNLVPGTEAVFSDTVNNYRLSTGVDNGDGNQASHWKADELTSVLIGVMDPTLPFHFSQNPGPPDFRAFDLMGYDLALNEVPEPGAVLLSGFGLLVLAALRRRA